VARELGRLQEAEAELERARAAALPSGRGGGDRGAEHRGADAGGAEAILENARGQILLARSQPSDAEAAFRRALADAVDPDAVVTVSGNLAEALLAQGRVLETGQVLRRAEETALTRSVVPRLPEIYTLAARVAAARGHADAFVLFERALQIVASEQLPDFERARVLEAYGRYDLDRGEGPSGRARLDEARRIYETLGAEAALERLRGFHDAAGDETL
jgi:tetratricopeptide (TPR) repeat protein